MTVSPDLERDEDESDEQDEDDSEGDRTPVPISIEGRTRQSPVGASDLVISSDDPESATLGEDIDVLANGTDGRSSTSNEAPTDQHHGDRRHARGAHSPADKTDLFHVPVTGEAEGTVTLDVAEVREFAGTSGQPYLIENVTPATVNVGSGGIGLPTLPPEPDPEGPKFTISGFELSTDEVTTTETFEVTATIKNIGDEGGTVELPLLLAGEVEATESITLAEGGEKSVTFDLTAPDKPGEIDLELQTSDNESTASITVEEADDSGNESSTGDGSDATDNPLTTGDETEGDSIPGFGVVVSLCGLFGAAALRVRM